MDSNSLSIINIIVRKPKDSISRRRFSTKHARRPQFILLMPSDQPTMTAADR